MQALGNWELRLDTKTIYASDSAEKIYGLYGGQLELAAAQQYTLPQYRPLLDNALKELIENEASYNVEFKIKNAETGDIIDIHSIAEYDIDKKTIFGVIQDITERKQIQEALEKLNSEKDKLFSIIAHDLRSPFHGLLGLTEIMAANSSEMASEEISKFSCVLYESVANLYRLLENLLEWAQIRKDFTIYTPSEIFLTDVFAQSREDIKQIAIQKAIAIENEITNNLKIFADEKMINSVLRNLLSNAVKFTKTGGRVTCKARETEEQMIEVSIADTGVGMPSDIIRKLFILGEDVGMRGTENEPSTGLGLLLCKEFVEKHGGKIWAESIEDIGSTFYFTVPTLSSSTAEINGK